MDKNNECYVDYKFLKNIVHRLYDLVVWNMFFVAKLSILYISLGIFLSFSYVKENEEITCNEKNCCKTLG